MADTQSIKEHIKAIRDEVRTAGDKQDAEAKTAVRNALSHVEMARKEIDSQVQTDMTQDQADRKKMLDHLQTVATEGAAALKENGAKMRTNIRNMLDKTEEMLTKDV
jgi:polyhydroxyalkanoate synthesis regulator phasin